MKIFESLENLEEKLISTINDTTGQKIMSITTYNFIIDAYNGNFF